MSPPPGRPAHTPEAQAEALARVALGDRSAFAALYAGTRSHLFGVILRIQADRAQAEDILQDVFITLWRTAASYQPERSQALTWMSTIARNRAIDSLRRARTEPRTVSRWTSAASVEGGDEADLLDALPDPSAGPFERLQQASQARALSACLDRLEQRERQCLALAYYQGLSHAEVAEHLALPLGSVKSWVRRSLMALKACLGGGAASASTVER